MKRIIAFDLDGTLCLSKARIDFGMGDLLCFLLESVKVAIITGGSLRAIMDQLVMVLPPNDIVDNLILYPMNASECDTFEKGMLVRGYAEPLGLKLEVLREIFFVSTCDMIGWQTPYGDIMEDRGPQISFSALGQEAPLEIKSKWDPDHKKRERIVERVRPLISEEYDLLIAGTTSIDVVRKGIDKGHAIRKMLESGFRKEDILFVGDALFPGGNDYPVKEMGVDVIEVKDPEETKEVIRKLLKEMAKDAGSKEG